MRDLMDLTVLDAEAVTVRAAPPRSAGPCGGPGSGTQASSREEHDMESTTQLQPETVSAIHRLTQGTVSTDAMRFGVRRAEPLLLGLDGLLRYAKAYGARFEQALATDAVLGTHWLAAAQGLRGLLNGDGAAAYEADRRTDSKDNGVLEAVFWAALREAGFTEEDL